MTEPRHLSDEERANLIAYLDGELEGEAAEDMAARLSLDAGVRAEAEALKRTWDLLDYLPRAEPSPNFTHRTLERLTALRPAVKVRRRRWAGAVGWAAAVLLTAAAGFAGVWFFYPPDRTDQELVRDLRVIENRRQYEAVDDIDFLWELSQPDLFGDDSQGS